MLSWPTFGCDKILVHLDSIRYQKTLTKKNHTAKQKENSLLKIFFRLAKHFVLSAVISNLLSMNQDQSAICNKKELYISKVLRAS